MNFSEINFSEINISDKPLFDRYLKQLNPEASEFTFTNMFMWRKLYRFRYTICSDLLCIIADPVNSGPFAMMPAGKLDSAGFAEAVKEIEVYFRERGWPLVFKRITERQLEYFKLPGLKPCSIELDRDSSDYLYNSSDLINLKGKKYDGKRNHINKFKKNHTFEYEVLSGSMLAECERIMEDWCKSRDCECQNGEYCERYANLEVMRNYDAMGCKGAIIKVDGSYEAFTVGEMLNDETAVIHIEKAGKAIDGLYTVINQQFCEHEWQDVPYINREQDLGIEGIRKAKLSYNPAMLINKYIVQFNLYDL